MVNKPGDNQARIQVLRLGGAK